MNLTCCMVYGRCRALCVICQTRSVIYFMLVLAISYKYIFLCEKCPLYDALPTDSGICIFLQESVKS